MWNESIYGLPTFPDVPRRRWYNLQSFVRIGLMNHVLMKSPNRRHELLMCCTSRGQSNLNPLFTFDIDEPVS